MTRICLHCNEEFSDEIDQCPVCYSRLYRQKISQRTIRRRRFSKKLRYKIIDYGKYLLGITFIIGAIFIAIAAIIFFGDIILQNTGDNSASQTTTSSQTYYNPTIAQQSYFTPTIAPQSKSYIDPRSISAIYVAENDIVKLNSKFSTDNLEFRFCLFGDSYKNGILISSMIETDYQSRSTTKFLATECPSSSIGFIHSHPTDGNCQLSSGDISTLNSEPFPIQGVICEKNRITFYTKSNPKNYIPIYEVSMSANNVIYSKDITPQTACSGERLCNGQCWLGCSGGAVWSCTAQRGMCTN